MKRIKRLLLAALGVASGLALVVALLAFSSVIVFAGTGADPSDAFRAPELENSSLSAARTWNENERNALLGTLEAERLGLAWADAFALIERRSAGDDVDFTVRFDESIAQHLAAPDDTVWVPFEVIEHDITIDLVSANRQVVALTVDVTVAHDLGTGTIEAVDTYEAVVANGPSGWTIATFNRTASSMPPN